MFRFMYEKLETTLVVNTKMQLIMFDFYAQQTKVKF